MNIEERRQIIEERKEAASSKLVERGFFVEYPTRPITLDTIPMDGSEFIHRSRLEDAKLTYCVDFNVNSLAYSDSPVRSMKRWGREQAKEFTDLAIKLNLDKQMLIKKFPKKMKTPEDEDEKKWCIFCLGSKMFAKIYGEDPPKKRRGNPPTLSIVLHLSQEQIMMLISYFCKWVQEIGINDNIGRWVYALFAILEKPVKDTFQKKLEAFHDHCEKIIQTSDNESYKRQVYIVVSLLKHYFCVKYDTMGPDVKRHLQRFKIKQV